MTEQGRSAPHLLALAARTPAALAALAEETLRALARLDGLSPRALCAGVHAAAGPQDAHRLAVTGHSAGELAARLAAHLSGGQVREVSAGVAAPAPRVAFLCSGQGAQYAGMGMDLHRSEPVYREAFDRCAEAAAPYVKVPLDELLGRGSATPEIHRLPHAALATFAVGRALAALWRDRGVEPDAVLGFGSGEYLAAHLAGALTLEDAVMLLAAETSLAARVGEGAMRVVGAGEEFVLGVLAGLGPRAARVGVAALLSSEDVSLSGAAGELAVVAERLSALGVRTSALPVPQGLHSPLQDPFLEELRAVAARVRVAAPRVPMVSTVTGRMCGRAELAAPEHWSAHMPAPEHWSAHMRGPVSFDAGIRTLDAVGITAYLEVGPGRALAGLGPRVLAGGDRVWTASIGRSTESAETMLRGLGRLFTAGVRIR